MALIRTLTSRSITRSSSRGRRVPPGGSMIADASSRPCLREMRLEASFQRLADVGPLLPNHAVVVRMPEPPTGHDHVVPERALEGGPDREQGGIRLLVQRIGLELDPVRPQHLE